MAHVMEGVNNPLVRRIPLL